jgi:hypothetical protein
LCGPGTKPHCVVTTKEMGEKREKREERREKKEKMEKVKKERKNYVCDQTQLCGPGPHKSFSWNRLAFEALNRENTYSLRSHL